MAVGTAAPTAHAEEWRTELCQFPPPLGTGPEGGEGLPQSTALSHAAPSCGPETWSHGEAITGTDPGQTRKPALGSLQDGPERGAAGMTPAERPRTSWSPGCGREGPCPGGPSASSQGLWACRSPSGTLSAGERPSRLLRRRRGGATTQTWGVLPAWPLVAKATLAERTPVLPCGPQLFGNHHLERVQPPTNERFSGYADSC